MHSCFSAFNRHPPEERGRDDLSKDGYGHLLTRLERKAAIHPTRIGWQTEMEIGVMHQSDIFSLLQVRHIHRYDHQGLDFAFHDDSLPPQDVISVLSFWPVLGFIEPDDRFSIHF